MIAAHILFQRPSSGHDPLLLQPAAGGSTKRKNISLFYRLAHRALLVRGHFRCAQCDSTCPVPFNQLRLLLCLIIKHWLESVTGSRRPPSRRHRSSRCCGSSGSHRSSSRRWALELDKLAKRKIFQNFFCPIANVLVLRQLLQVHILPLPVVHLAQDLAELISAAIVRVHAQLTESSHAFRIHLLWLNIPTCKSNDLVTDALRSCCRHGKHGREASTT